MVFASWSGGKDSCLACYRAVAQGLEVAYLVNMISEEFKRSGGHGVHFQLMLAQAEAMGIPMMQPEFTRDNYEAQLKGAIAELKAQGISGMVTGDIYLQEHRDWEERVCGDMGIEAILPLWGEDTQALMAEFIEAGFEAIVVATQADLLGEMWLGRKVDKQLVEDLRRYAPKVDLCGEAGEFHTFVTDGPLFRTPIRILETRPLLRDGRWFLDIVRYEVEVP